MRLTLFVVAVYLAVMFFIPITDCLLFPTTNAIDARGATRKLISFEKKNLEVWTAKSKKAQASGEADVHVLRFYGNADRAERWVALEAEMWNDRSVEIWGMNYPGFGRSDGPAHLTNIAPAALTAFDALKHDAANGRVILFGASIGTTAALHVATNRSVDGLVLHNPPPLRQLILGQYGWWNLWLLAGPAALGVPKELDSIRNAGNIHAPAVFLLADQDEVVGPRFQKMVVDAYAGEKRIIILHGAHHNSPIEGAAVTEMHAALDWLLPRTTVSR